MPLDPSVLSPSAGPSGVAGTFADGFDACQGLHALAALERGEAATSPLPRALQRAPSHYATLEDVQRTLQDLAALHPAFAAMATTVAEQAQVLNASVATETLYEQLTPHAQADCRYCDGRGVFYGNINLCGCVMAKLDVRAEPGVVLTESPLGRQRWHHGNGVLVCGTFRIARADWEAGVCEADNLREKLFDWMCDRLSAPVPRSTP